LAATVPNGPDVLTVLFRYPVEEATVTGNAQSAYVAEEDIPDGYEPPSTSHQSVQSVPEGGSTVILLGIGLLGLAVWGLLAILAIGHSK
jgi:hypothetical protein